MTNDETSNKIIKVINEQGTQHFLDHLEDANKSTAYVDGDDVILFDGEDLLLAIYIAAPNITKEETLDLLSFFNDKFNASVKYRELCRAQYETVREVPVVFTLKQEDHVLTQIPFYIRSGKNWLAKVSKDAKSPGGLKRDWLKLTPQYFYNLSDLKVGDKVEFGCRHENRRQGGAKHLYAVFEGFKGDKALFSKTTKGKV